MAAIKKNWGHINQVLTTNGVIINRIKVNPGGFCSVHYHAYKNNLFLVTSGALTIITGNMTSGSFMATRDVQLSVGDQLSISAGDWHQFRSRDGAEAIEIYWMEAQEQDIIRQL